jgi:uncharacterized membrane protein (DUF106 family)
METMYFVLGMLSVVATIFVAVIVWGLLKIKKQETIIRELMSRMDEDRRQFYEEARGMTQTFDRRFDDVWGVFRDVRNEMVELSKSDVELSKSYTDSRIDKLIDTYFDMVSAKKQIIK